MDKLSELYKVKPIGNVIAGYWEEPKIDFDLDVNEFITWENPQVTIFEDFLTYKDNVYLSSLFQRTPSVEAVSVQGMKTIDESGIGSYRSTMFSTNLARQFNKKIENWNHTIECTPYTRTDVQEGTWKVIGFSPMFRFMLYQLGGSHRTHYDRGFKYSDRIHTLQSVVIYLTTNMSGYTRFINDGQDDIPQVKRNNDDWDREAKDQEVISSNRPVMNEALIFHHRLPHDVSKLDEAKSRIIIRTDLIYERID